MIILKHNPKKHFSILFLIDGEENQPVGHLAMEGIELMLERKILVPVEQVEIIEKYFSSLNLIKDVDQCTYYQLTP